MHEQHLMQDLLARIEAVAVEQHATSVAGVRVWIGALSHFSAAGFREHFTRLAAGGVAARAQLDIMVSDDIDHPDAQGLRIQSIDLVDARPEAGA